MDKRFSLILKTLVSIGLFLANGNLHAQQPTEFEQIVNERHLSDNVIDLSQEEDIYIEEPRMAYINLTGFQTMPVTKHVTTKGWIEIYDGEGHYMSRPVTLAGQGGYTIRFPKRNFVCHFTDEEYNEDNGPTLHIGDWVGQDGFHFKAFWTDFMRGIGEVGYKLFHQTTRDRLPYWERGGYNKSSLARCYPDAFPCAVYLNGIFHGIYAWQLKKHHKNMNQKKLEPNHIHLDGNLRDDYIFKGHIKWSEFEVRNPKQLVCNNGTAYNGNFPKELISENSTYYNNADDDETTRQDKERTAAVKKAIINMSHYWNELQAIKEDGASDAVMRNEIEQRFDIEGLIDYYVFYYFSQNGDGHLKNWQWFTYDGHRWSVTPYDLDQTFGLGLYGGNVRPPYIDAPNLNQGPFYWMQCYYMDDICQRYAQMRDDGIFTYDNVVALFDDWYDRVGEEMYTREMQRWPDSPCYCEVIAGNGWQALDDWHEAIGLDNWQSNMTYNEGDICWYEGRPWVATTTVTGVIPVVRNSTIDTIDRLHDWVKGRIDYLDAYFAYNDNHTDVRGISDDKAQKRLTGIYSLDGKRLQRPVSGQVCIFHYSDGTSRKALVR